MREFFDQILYDYAMSLVHKPYKWGGDDPGAGFDCSGLVVELLHSCGMLDPNVDKNAQALYHHFSLDRAVETRLCSFGALIFYGHSYQRITHVAFGMDKSRMLEAGSGGRNITTMADAIRHNAFVRIRPYNYRTDLVTVLKPTYKSIGYF
jgi:cell wall-associated NlpC family hydrolase